MAPLKWKAAPGCPAPAPSRRSLLPWAALLALACLTLTPSRAQEEGDSVETKIKAAFLYKFAGYIEWPKSAFERANAPLVFGVAGAEPVADELSAMVSGRTIEGRPIAVRKIAPGESTTGVQVLFVGKASGSRPAEMLAATKGKPILTVTDSDDGLAKGSVINFVIVDNKVRFDVALGPAESGQIKLSARLLSVARKVFASSAGS
jgi:hypothetical protein